MISNQILQNTIEGLKGITKIDFCVMDTEGKVLAGTFAEQVNQGKESFVCRITGGQSGYKGISVF